MSKNYYLGVDSATAITLYPEFDYKYTKIKDESVHRSRGENLDLTKYKWGSYDKFTFSLNYVPDSDSQQINEWWLDNTDLIFFIVDSAGDCTPYDVQINNKKYPFRSTNIPYIDQWKGNLILESYN